MDEFGGMMIALPFIRVQSPGEDSLEGCRDVGRVLPRWEDAVIVPSCSDPGHGGVCRGHECTQIGLHAESLLLNGRSGRIAGLGRTMRRDHRFLAVSYHCKMGEYPR